jgi:hypothetical protein
VVRRLDLARQTERACQQELAEFQQEQIAEFAAALQRLGQSLKRVSQPLTSALTTNVAEVEAKFQALVSQRAELARTRTDAHPMIRELDEQLAKMREKLAELGSARRSTSEQHEPFGEIEHLQIVSRRRTVDIAKRLEDANLRCEDLEQESAILAQPPAAISLRTELASPAEIVQRDGGTPSMARLWLFAFLATAAGGAMFHWAQLPSSESGFSSCEDLSAELNLPVAAVAGVIRPPSAKPASIALRRSVLAAEILLAVLAVCGLAAIAGSSETTQPISQDPFGTIAEALDRVGEGTFIR